MLCLFGFGLSPSSEKAREAGRPVGVVFRGHHEGPLLKRAGEVKERNPDAEKSDLKTQRKFEEVPADELTELMRLAGKVTELRGQRSV